MKKAFSIMAFVCLALGSMVAEPTEIFVRLVAAGAVCIVATILLDKVEAKCGK